MAAYANLCAEIEAQSAHIQIKMDVVRKINALALIKEVEQYPILYNNKLPNHTQLTSEMRKKAWEMIAEKLCGEEYWQNYNDSDRESIGKEIQLKFKNLKDNYHRILRKEKEDEENEVIHPTKRKKYIYYDALEFLKPFAPGNKKNAEMKDEVELGGKNAPNIIFINETNDLEEEPILQTTPPVLPKSSIKVQPPTIAPMPSFGTLQPVQLIQFQPNSSIPVSPKEEGEEAASGKLTKILEQLVRIQEEEKSDDPMGNKKFLLSLVPFMKKLPDDVNLEVRLQIMGVIQTYAAKDLF